VNSKYVFVSGGVVSGLGKGITTASIGKILQSKAFSVTAIKIDPYINYDAGTLRPTEHGEVWVTDDGGEIDQDLGQYERFLDISISKDHNITTGQVYLSVIEKERRGEFLGETVEVIPHITDEVKERIRSVAQRTRAEFVLVEIGGTIGEYQNVIYFEAARQMKLEGDPVLFIHLTYIPVLKHLGEAKTKPTQHSVKELREVGIQPDLIVCRSEQSVDEPRRQKIALYSNVLKEDIISNPDTDNIYRIPLILEDQKLGDRILGKLGLTTRPTDLIRWRGLVEKMEGSTTEIRIGIVGKYFDTGQYSLPDSYTSIIEALKHAAFLNDARPRFHWMDSKRFEAEHGVADDVAEVDGIIVPGGFGAKGTEGKITAILHARESRLPFLGLCFGFQLSVVEYARNVCGLSEANSTEINAETPHPVIDLLPAQREAMRSTGYGATMRLGGQTVLIKPGTLASDLYGKKRIRERFRHRYEVNPEYVSSMEKAGFTFSGYSEEDGIMQIGEIPNHPFFIGSQFHPEFTSRPLRPNPLFLGFVKACLRPST
jgi:CTP synthase